MYFWLWGLQEKFQKTCATSVLTYSCLFTIWCVWGVWSCILVVFPQSCNYRCFWLGGWGECDRRLFEWAPYVIFYVRYICVEARLGYLAACWELFWEICFVRAVLLVDAFLLLLPILGYNRIQIKYRLILICVLVCCFFQWGGIFF